MAYVDLSSISSDVDISKSIPMTIQISMPTSISDSYELMSKTPYTVDVILDETTEVMEELYVSTVGDIASGYIMGEIELSVDKVQILGAGRDVSSISYIGLAVDVTGATEDVIGTYDIYAYDELGNVIDNVEFSQGTVDVKVPIYTSKVVGIQVSSYGIPNEGYMLKDMDVLPTAITIVGNKKIIDTISEIALPSVDISGKIADFVTEYNISDILGTNVFVMNGETNKIIVNTDIGKIEENEIILPYAQIQIVGELPEGYTAKLEETDIVFYINGDEEIVDTLELDMIEASVDVTEMDLGGYVVSIDVVLPEGLEIVGTHPRTTISIVETSTLEENIDEENLEDSENTDEEDTKATEE